MCLQLFGALEGSRHSSSNPGVLQFSEGPGVPACSCSLPEGLCMFRAFSTYSWEIPSCHGVRM